MRLQVAVFSLCAAAFLMPRSGFADPRGDEAHRMEEARRADEVRRAEEARRLHPMEPGHRPEEMHHPDDHRPVDVHVEVHGEPPPPPMAVRHGEWRLADFEARERAHARFEAAERAEYERLKAERLRRYYELQELDARRERDRQARRIEEQRILLGRYRHALVSDSSVREEFERDAQILAQLRRAREVAEADGRLDVVARADRLIIKENARHAAWLAAHQLGAL